MNLHSWLKRVLKTHPTSVSSNATADDIRRFICPCPACGNGQVQHVDGHQHALLASEIAHEPSAELGHFFHLYKNRNWAELNQIQRFDGAFNAALIYAV